MTMTVTAPLYECNVDIGPHFGFPKLAKLEVWPDHIVFQEPSPLDIQVRNIDDVQRALWWGDVVVKLQYHDETGQAKRLRFAASNRLTPNRTETEALFDILQRVWRGSAAGDTVLSALPGAASAPDAALVEAVYENRVRLSVVGVAGVVLFGAVLAILGSPILGLDPIWGLVLGGVAVAAWRRPELPWLIVMTVFLWASAVVAFVTAPQPYASIITIILGGFAVSNYFTLRRHLTRPLAEAAPLTARWLPGVGVGAGVLAAALFVGVFAAFGLMPPTPTLRTILITVGDAVLPLAVLAFGAGLASLLSFRARRVAAALGVVLGAAIAAAVVYLAL